MAAQLGTALNFQLVADVQHDRAFPEHRVRVMGYERFLAGLV
jgi:hypothetical protein